jgi:membrane protease YdiL (CAAX protease family)
MRFPGHLKKGSGGVFLYPLSMPVDGDLEPSASRPGPSQGVERQGPTLVERIMAVLEVVICSDYPTQIALGTTFAALGFGPSGANGELSLAYVVFVSLTDTVLLLGLIAMFLSVHRESPRDLLFGARPILPEAVSGVPLVLAAFLLGVTVLVVIQLIAPSLHTVAKNPLQTLIRTPRDTALFALVIVLAGGIREEVQRAFLLNRFERWLGGGTLGVVVTSVSFGAGHIIQGLDAAAATGVLGAFWAIVYLRRRSVAAPIVSHSGFNLLQLVQFLIVGR